MKVTYDEFRDSLAFMLKKSTIVNDGWKLEISPEGEEYASCSVLQEIDIYNDDTDDPYEAMQLVKVCCTFDYKIIYSKSYQVPLLFANVYKPSGKLLSLDELWRSLPIDMTTNLNKWSALTRTEHPFLDKPYYQVHPCHTESLMNTIKPDKELVI